jgi:NADH dehydrogenase
MALEPSSPADVDERPAGFAASGLPERPPWHRIVIVGGGAGGLPLAARLGDRLRGRRDAEVLLVDAGLTHVWKPLLHELAAGTLDAPGQEVEFLQQALRHGFRFHLGSLEGLERAAHRIWLAPLLDDEGAVIAPRRPVAYDTLVLALGSIVNDFGTPGVQLHASRLDTAQDARRFHRRVLAACARAEIHADGPVEVVIVGGGATGVELAAELVQSGAELARYGAMPSRLGQPLKVTVEEAGPRLLAALPAHIGEHVHRQLVARGVDVRIGDPVTAVTPDAVRLRSGESLPARLTVWAAGIQGAPLLARLDGLELNRTRQIVVRPTLQTTVDDDVFAFGDCAFCVPGPDGAPVPPRAAAAQQQASFLVGALRGRLAGRALPAFTYRERGSLVTLGREEAVGNLVAQRVRRSLTVHGTAARLAYWSLHRRHLVALHGFARTALATFTGWLESRTGPRVKLH